MTTQARVEWKWGALAALAITLIALYPQLNLWLVRGDAWQGSYVLTQGDEVTYSAYVNALIDGRPRKNDPFSGRDFQRGRRAYESLHSIQFVPAYVVALPARVLGLTASTAFIWLLVIAAIASTLAIFWLLATLTGDSKSAAVGALFTLSFGALVGSDCCWSANAFTEMVPFLRRYQPAAVFPLFFVFCGLIWRAVTGESARSRLLHSAGAGLLVVLMMFSYFYIWTAALAWFVCVAFLWILFRREEAARVARISIVLGAFLAAGIAVFLIMFLNRDPVTAQGQLLVSTRAPDLFNQPQTIGFIALGVVAQAAWRKQVDFRSPLVLFSIAFATMPFVVFNQQLITGTSLQPIHYKVFIANYVSLISVVLISLILWRVRDPQRPVKRSVLLVVTLAALGWAMVEVSAATARGAHKAILRDNFRAITKRMTALAVADGSVQAALAGRDGFPTVFTFAVDDNLEVSKSIPTDGPLAVLWSLHSDAFISAAESKERFYRHLYYAGLTPKMVGSRLRENKFWVVVPIFGSERVIEGLVPVFKPVTLDEIASERRGYADFYNNFTREHALNPTLEFVVVPNGPSLPNFANLDRWYERDSGEQIGAFTLYRVALRP